jgi:hypothetical protein
LPAATSALRSDSKFAPWHGDIGFYVPSMCPQCPLIALMLLRRTLCEILHRVITATPITIAARTPGIKRT